MNVRRKVDKRILDTSWHTASLSYYRNDYYKGQQNSIGERYFFVVVVRCTSAILYNLIAMWHLVLAFMLKSYVCIVALYSPSPFIRRCDGGVGDLLLHCPMLQDNQFTILFLLLSYVFSFPFFFLFFINTLSQNYPDMAWLRQQGLSNYYTVSSFIHLVFLVKYPFQGGSVWGCKFWCLRLGAYHWP